MKLFGRLLLGGWTLLIVTVGLCFAFPKAMSQCLGPIANFFVLIPISLLFGSALYGVMRIYHAGMKRSSP